MKKLILVYLITLCFGALNSLSIKLKSKISTTNEKITLENVVDKVTGNKSEFNIIRNMIVENLPYEKQFINLKASVIRKRIKEKYNLDTEIDGGYCVIRWAKNLLNEEIVENAVLEFISKNFDLKSEDRIEIDRISEIYSPSDSVVFSFNEIKPFSGNKYRIYGNIHFLSKIISKFETDVKIIQYREIPVAKKSIKRNQVISENDIVIIKKVVLKPELLISKEEIIGNLASKYISAGVEINAKNIKEKPLVKRNEIVKVLVKSKNINLEYESIAKKEGYFGDIITCQNPISKEKFNAKIIAKKYVEIDLGE